MVWLGHLKKLKKKKKLVLRSVPLTQSSLAKKVRDILFFVFALLSERTTLGKLEHEFGRKKNT